MMALHEIYVLMPVHIVDRVIWHRGTEREAGVQPSWDFFLID